MKTPAQTQDLELGGKTAADIIGADFSLTVDGSVVRAAGEVKNLTEPWTDFDTKNNTGHFIPVQLPAVCQGQKLTCKGRVDGDRTVTIDEGLLLVLRLENFVNPWADLYIGNEFFMRIDWTDVIPAGADAFDSAKEDYGTFGKKTDFLQDVTITWDGVTGHVKGTIKNHEAIGEKVKAGMHFPIPFSAWYDNVNKDIIADGKRSTYPHKDIIQTVTKKTKLITAEYQGVEIMRLDFTGATFGG